MNKEQQKDTNKQKKIQTNQRKIQTKKQLKSIWTS